MVALFYVLAAIATIASWSCLSMLKKYNEVRKIGLPVLFTPVPYRSILWRTTKGQLERLFKHLPFGLGNFVEHTKMGGNWHFRTPLHDKYGPAFFVVSPGPTELIIADAAATEEVFTRSRQDFVKPVEAYKAMNIFGVNVVTVNGEAWQRHRLITTPPFNERNSNLVWRESRSQAEGMLQSWMKEQKDGGVTSTAEDTLTLALNVLMSAGLGRPCSYGEENSGHGQHDSYRDTLRFILDNLGLAILTNWYKLPLKILPKKLTQVKRAVNDFKAYLMKMVEEERTNSVKKIGSHTQGDNLMSALVRSSESTGRHSLSDQEIVGNLFVYNIAGHDTTANTLAYAITRLAADVETQEWVREELDAVLGTQEELEYEKVFPQLKRCLAVMYETLRLYTPVINLPRLTTSDLPLKINGKVYTIPKDISVVLNLSILHTRPEYWGQDSQIWRPQRWIITHTSSNDPSSTASKLANETLFQPIQGSFEPWITGPRVCPGKKFAQVEFVAVLVTMLRGHVVRPVLLEDDGGKKESEEEARERVVEVAEDSITKITLKMREPTALKLRWEEIGG